MDPESITKGIESICVKANQVIDFHKLGKYTDNLEESLYKNYASFIQNRSPQVFY